MNDLQRLIATQKGRRVFVWLAASTADEAAAMYALQDALTAAGAFPLCAPLVPDPEVWARQADTVLHVASSVFDVLAISGKLPPGVVVHAFLFTHLAQL